MALVYGKDGLGKSTFASQAPAPIFVGPEVAQGTKNLDVARAPHPANFSEVIAQIDELATARHEFQTLVFESLDWFEPMVWQHVCDQQKWANIEAPGYGKGYVIAQREWEAFRDALQRVVTRGMNAVLIAHSMVKTFNDPATGAAYDRFQVKLQDRAAALLREFVDDVLFVNQEVITAQDKNLERKGKVWALGEGVRLIYAEGRPGFDAKNRHGLPFTLPLSWEDYSAAVESGNPQDPEVLQKSILAMIDEVTDDELKKAAVAWYEKTPKDDAAKLAVIENRLRLKLKK